MNPIHPLNLPKTNLNLSRKGDKIYVFCQIRRKQILLTPEEWVRQHFIAYLSNVLEYPIEVISVEKSLNYFGMTKRWDIVVYNSQFSPCILIECKAPQVSLSENALGQVLSYQNQLQCEFIGITNGINHFFWQVSGEEKKIKVISEIPKKNQN